MAQPITNCITLGGVDFAVRFRSPVTPLYFRDFLSQTNLPNCPETVSVNRKELSGSDNEPFTEFNLLLREFSTALLPHDRCLFHGVALAIGERAWLLTAPSGTGKSTQYRLWKRLFGDDVRLICGDKPVLEFRDGEIWVHPSPWMGKERWSGSPAAKLAGIVYLEQGSRNTIRPMAVSEAVVPLYAQFLCHPTEEGHLRRLSAMLERLLTAVPVWKLVNLGDEDSARLTAETLLGKGGT